MADERSDDPSREDETAKLELPSLSLKGLRRSRRPRREQADPLASEERLDVAEPVDTPANPEPDETTPPVGDPDPVRPDSTTAAPGPQRTTVDTLEADAQADAKTDAEADAEAKTDSDADATEPRGPRLPTVPGWILSLVTGVVVGICGALLTYLSLRGCDAVRGTKSCGGGPGLLLLVVILVLMVVLGAVLLAALHLPDARATSLLGIGVLCVVVLLTLMDEVFSPWMFLVVPVLCGAGYALAHAVTTAFIDPTPEPGPEHDVR